MRIETWLSQNTASLKGKRIAVTGSTGGLGKVLCSYLVALRASLVLLDRNVQRSEAHRNSLCEQFGEADVTCIPLDLEDLTSARRASDQLIGEGIDVFIHNAGAYSISRHACKSGYDNVFQINFATPYFMIRKLLPMLRARHGRVVVVGSIAHRYSHIDENDVDFSTRKAASKVYGNAKRYLMFSLYELFKHERDVALAVTHPGITLTGITSHYPKPIFAIIKHPMKIIFMNPRKAALSILSGIYEGTAVHQWIGPCMLDIWGLPKKKRLRSCSQAEQEKIAELAERVFEQCERTEKEDQSP